MRRLDWGDLTSADFGGLDPEATIAILPVAAIEQHGPHLPVSTDTIINDGMLAEFRKQVPEDLSVLILPTQAIGKSTEHMRMPGTITLSAETAMRAWIEIGESVHRAGLRKLVMLNSHGGNSKLISIVADELRLRCRMLAVATHWGRFGNPPGAYTDQEIAVGIHAGDIETSLMLHFRPDLVAMDKAGDFPPSTIAMEQEFALLRPTGAHAFGWMAEDLHPSGAAGDASRSTAEKGRATAELRVAEFIRLLRDMRDFSLDRLA